MGAPKELAEKMRAPPATDFLVLPEAWEVLRFFLGLKTQWEVIAGPAGILHKGLNYQSIEFLFRVHKIKNRTEYMDHLQAMESAALVILNG